MISAVEHLFMCLLPIYISSLKKSLFEFFDHFSVALFIFLLLSCRGSLYILDINLYQIHDLQIFSPIVWVAFHSANSVLWCTKDFNLDKVQPIYFFFCCLCFSCHSQEIIAKSC